MQNQSLLNKWKAKNGITSNIQVLLIIIVFSITGSASVQLAAPILEYLGISKEMGPWVYWPLRILIIFPCYQILLIIFGTLLGQFRFFWGMEKKMMGRFVGKKY